MEETDLRALVGHRERLEAGDGLDVAYSRFEELGVDFLPVVDGESVVGLCRRLQLDALLASPYGRALYARRPVGGLVDPGSATCVEAGERLSAVLSRAFSRPRARVFDDVVLLDESSRLVGLIPADTLVKLQTSYLLRNIEELELKEARLRARNLQMEEDLRVAGRLQQTLFAAGAPGERDDGAFRIEHRYRPAGIVGGDFFHVARLADGSVAVLLADVVGHGVRSALVTAIIRALVETLRPVATEPAILLEALNGELAALHADADDPVFATAVALHLDAADGTLSWANAGHLDPIVLRDEGPARLTLPDDERSLPLGLTGGEKYSPRSARLEEGDVVVLFTDGIVEAQDASEEPFGEERLVAGAAAGRGKGLAPLLDALLAAMERHAGRPERADDVCLVGIERLAPQRPG